MHACRYVLESSFVSVPAAFASARNQPKRHESHEKRTPKKETICWNEGDSTPSPARVKDVDERTGGSTSFVQGADLTMQRLATWLRGWADWFLRRRRNRADVEEGDTDRLWALLTNRNGDNNGNSGNDANAEPSWQSVAAGTQRLAFDGGHLGWTTRHHTAASARKRRSPHFPRSPRNIFLRR